MNIKMNLVLGIFVLSIELFCTVKPNVDVEKLFHANPPTLSLTRASNTNDDYKPYKGPRHDGFDWSLTKKALGSSDRINKIISPIAVKLLLSVITEAASTRTQVELMTILPNIVTFNEAREFYSNILESILRESEDYELIFGVKIYVDYFIQPRQRFAAIIKSSYYTEIEAVNFGSATAASNVINTWIESKTKNVFTDIVRAVDLRHSIILLISTVNFKGFWNKPFHKDETAAGNFFLDTGSTIIVPMMTRTDNYFFFESAELDSKIIRLPYRGNKLSMFIVLPNKRNGLDELITTIDSSIFRRSQILMDKQLVKVSLPKFKISSSNNFKEIVKSMEIRQVFTLQASLPQLIRGTDIGDRLQVSEILQTAGIEVQDDLISASDAIASSTGNEFGDSKEFKVDRPFLFLIEVESTGTSVLTGIVTNPIQ